MESTSVLALVAFVGLCSAAPNHAIPGGNSVIVNHDIDAHTQAASAAERIVGGTATTVNAYPWIVQMEFFSGIWRQACAANILNAIYVLSAAQCTHEFLDPFYRIENRRIRAGATYRGSEGIIREFMWVLNHELYYPTADQYYINHDSDISLIRLNQPLTLGTTIQSVPIAPQNYYLPDNVPIVHAGWGTNSTGGSYSDVLQHVTVNSINNNLCRERYSYYYPYQHISYNMICTGVLNAGGRDACEGDVGGPLYYGSTLVGIISWGLYCADSYYPRVSTKVSSYTDWIVMHASPATTTISSHNLII